MSSVFLSWIVGVFLVPALVPDLTKLTDAKAWRVVNAEVTPAIDGKQRLLRMQPKPNGTDVGSNVGLAIVEGSTFGEGTIELDLQGLGAQQASFVGVAFGLVDDKTFESIYFRPFNFQQPDETRRAHSVQYVAWPTHTWEKLRKDRPGQFETTVKPIPDPAAWFHARIEITKAQVRVWVDDGKEPCLLVPRLATARGKVALLVDSKAGAFRNLTIRPAP